jgi:hypothetical protein
MKSTVDGTITAAKAIAIMAMFVSDNQLFSIAGVGVGAFVGLAVGLGVEVTVGVGVSEGAGVSGLVAACPPPPPPLLGGAVVDVLSVIVSEKVFDVNPALSLIW